MPDIGQQAPRKWVVEEENAKADARRKQGAPGGGPLPPPSGRRARQRRMLFAGATVGVALVAVSAYVIWGGGAEALGLVDPPRDPTAGLDARRVADVHKLVMASTRLSDAQIATLEDRVGQTPGDLAARTRLIAFYSSLDHKQASAGRMHEEHVLWVVTNEPTAPILGTLHAQMRFPEAAYKTARRSLLAALNKTPEDLVLLRNAGTFLGLHDPQVADKLFARGQALEPDNSDWSLWRGELDLKNRKKAPKDAAQAKAQDREQGELDKALAKLDGKKIEVPPGNPPFSQLGDLAMSAWSEGRYRKAQTYALTALRRAPDYTDSWAYGEVVHLANAVVGHLALQVGRTDLAEKYLMRAGRTPGSPRLDARGPDLTLPKALLAKGRKEAVLGYFERCKGFWTAGKQNGTLSRWTKQLRAGADPDFKVP